jgi:hypothetical protein
MITSTVIIVIELARLDHLVLVDLLIPKFCQAVQHLMMAIIGRPAIVGAVTLICEKGGKAKGRARLLRLSCRYTVLVHHLIMDVDERYC